MLKRENRLISKFEFYITKNKGTHYESECFHLYVLKARTTDKSPKIGFVVSNKFDKRATARNIIKRLFREAFRTTIPAVPRDYWLVVYPKARAQSKSYEEISTDVNKTIQKVFSSN